MLDVDRKYGEQFKADGYVTVKPATLVGIEKYLGSGLVRGIGRVMAKRLVEQFALTTLEVIEQAPERLREVDGIGPVRSALWLAKMPSRRESFTNRPRGSDLPAP